MYFKFILLRYPLYSSVVKVCLQGGFRFRNSTFRIQHYIGQYTHHVIMEYLLEKLRHRIKGASIYRTHSGPRLYIPYHLDYPYPVRIKVFFQEINARPELFVRIESDTYTEDWCRQEAVRIKGRIAAQFHELIYDCELACTDIPLHRRLGDRAKPVYTGASSAEKEAATFLCSRKVAALLSNSRPFRWSASITLAMNRLSAGQVDRLFIFLPGADIKPFKEVFFALWKDLLFPVLFTPVESLSHNIQRCRDITGQAGPRTMVIIDSCHLFKSPDSVRSLRMKEITDKCSYKLIMTESMIVRDIHDIYMQYNLLSPMILRYYRWEDFARKHVIYGGRGGEYILGYKNIAYLVEMVKPYTYSREIATPKHSRRAVETIYCELTDRQRYYYACKKDELITMIEKNELSLHDVFRVFIQLQKIVCGYPSGRNSGRAGCETNKLNLLREHLQERSVIFCKFLFEIELLLCALGPDNCIVVGRKGKKDATDEKQLFSCGDKKYMIATLYFPDDKLSGIGHFSQVLFFSLSFRYTDYRRCFSYIEETGMSSTIPVKRFVTNSGIDKVILGNLKRKGKLSRELKRCFADKSQLIRFIKGL